MPAPAAWACHPLQPCQTTDRLIFVLRLHLGCAFFRFRPAGSRCSPRFRPAGKPMLPEIQTGGQADEDARQRGRWSIWGSCSAIHHSVALSESINDGRVAGSSAARPCRYTSARHARACGLGMPPLAALSNDRSPYFCLASSSRLRLFPFQTGWKPMLPEIQTGGQADAPRDSDRRASRCSPGFGHRF